MFYSPRFLPAKKSRSRNHVFRCQTDSLVTPTALHADGTTKLGTAATNSLFMLEGSDCCVVQTEFTSAYS